MDARSRKTLTLLLQAISKVGQNRIAEALGVSDATVSRMKDDLPRFAMLLTAVGAKPVPVNSKSYSPKYIESLEFFAQRGMGNNLPDEDGEDTGIHWENTR